MRPSLDTFLPFDSSAGPVSSYQNNPRLLKFRMYNYDVIYSLGGSGVPLTDMSDEFTPPRSNLGNRLRQCHTFEISGNVGYFGTMVRALPMSPKGRNASRDGLVKLFVAVCLLKFVCYLVIYYVLGS